MNGDEVVQCGLEEFCQLTELHVERVVEIVELGIVEPVARAPGDWRFDTRAVVRARRALRLHRDLQIDWSGIALALQLLDDVEHLQRENERLRRRLQRFLEVR